MTNSAPDYSFRMGRPEFDTGQEERDLLWLRSRRHGAADHLQGLPVKVTPLITAQRLALDSAAVMCVCEDYRAAQRHFCEASEAFDGMRQQPVLIHEMMPRYQQEYLMDCLRAMSDYEIGCLPVVFTSARFYRDMGHKAPEVLVDFKLVEVGQPAIGDKVVDDGEAAPTITCICLRSGAGGRWVLMDHEAAAVALPTAVPCDDLTRRLLNHSVEISGARIAPYLAMMFDVPQAWKYRAELTQCALLVFRDDECPTGCVQGGIPGKILWNDVLGIVFQ